MMIFSNWQLCPGGYDIFRNLRQVRGTVNWRKRLIWRGFADGVA